LTTGAALLNPLMNDNQWFGPNLILSAGKIVQAPDQALAKNPNPALGTNPN
jgi:hypothetical protein